MAYEPRMDSVAGRQEEDRRKNLEAMDRYQLIGMGMRVYASEDNLATKDKEHSAKVSELNTEIQDAKTEISRLGSALGAAKSDAQSYKSGYEASQATLGSLQSDYNKLKGLATGLGATNQQLSSSLQYLRTTLDDKNRELSTLNEELSALKNPTSTTASPLTTLDNEGLMQKIRFLMEELTEANQRRAQLTDDVQVLEQRILELSS